MAVNQKSSPKDSTANLDFEATPMSDSAMLPREAHRGRSKAEFIATLRETLLPKLLSGEFSVAKKSIKKHLRSSINKASINKHCP